MKTGAELASIGRNLNTEDRATVLAFRKEVTAWARVRGVDGDPLRESIGLSVANAFADLGSTEDEISGLATQIANRLAALTKRPGRANNLGELRVSSDAQRLDALCIELAQKRRNVVTMLSQLALA